MIYVLWYKLKGPDAPWIVQDFALARTRGQFIARHRKGLSEWAIDTLNGGLVMTTPPPKHLKVHRSP